MQVVEGRISPSPHEPPSRAPATYCVFDVEPQRSSDVLRGVGGWESPSSNFFLPSGSSYHHAHSHSYNKSGLESPDQDFNGLFEPPTTLSDVLASDTEGRSPSSLTSDHSHNCITHRAPRSNEPAFRTGAQSTSSNSPLTTTATPRSNTCSVCHRSFPSCELLERHARNAAHRIYICSVGECRKSYYRRDGLSRHKARHRQTSSHMCRICAGRGDEKVFNRKDHLLQHLRNCHANAESDRWRWDSVDCLQNDNALFSGWESLGGCSGPTNGHIRAGGQISVEDDGLSSASSCSSPYITDHFGENERAAAALEHTITDILGHKLSEVPAIKERLGLRAGSSKEQMADALRELLMGATKAENGIRTV